MPDSDPDKVDVDNIMENFRWCYSQSLDNLRRLAMLKQTYTNIANPDAWPSDSCLPLALLFAQTEKALPGAVDYLFNSGVMLQFLPTESGVSMDAVLASERVLSYTMRYTMELEHNSHATLRDCFSLGLGTGIVEPIVVTPDASFTNLAVDADGNIISKARTVRAGSAKRSVRFRYGTPGQFLVTPDGSDFNGPQRCSVRYFVDSMSESQFRDMMSKQVTDEDQMSADLIKTRTDLIIKDAQNNGHNNRIPIEATIAQLGGIDLRNLKQHEGAPVRIPIIKMCEDHRHVWLANGKYKILDLSNEGQIMRCPYIRAAAGIEGNNFYPMSVAEASQSVNLGINHFVNALFDILQYYARPMMAWNSHSGGEEPTRQPGKILKVNGSIRDSVGYVDQPQLTSQVFAVGDVLQNMMSEVTGQSQDSQMSPGMVRGGGFALSDMMKSKAGRSTLANAVLGTGFLKSVAAQTFILIRENILQGPEVFAEREFDPQTGQDVIRDYEITEEDVVHALSLKMSTRSRVGASALTFAERQADLDNAKGSDLHDQYQVWVDYYQDEERARRLLKTPVEVRRMQEEDRQLANQERAQGIQQAASTRQEPAAQGLAGAGASALAGA